MPLPQPKLPARHPRYTYLTTDLITGRVLEEVPLGGVQFGKRLNDAGTCTGSFTYTAATAALLRPATSPARTVLNVLRDGQCVWGGIIWARTINHATRVVDLQCADLWSYFDHRRLLSALTFTGADAATIAAALLAAAQATTAGDIGIDPPTTSPLTRLVLDQAYRPWSYATFAQLLTDLATLDGGPDLRFDITGTSANLTRQLLIGTPHLGRPFATSGIVLDYGGTGAALTSLSETEDGSTAETSHYALGPGQEAAQLVGVATRPDLITGGWPLLEGTSSRSDDSIGQHTIDLYAAADLAAVAGLKTTLMASSRLIEVGTFDPGDEARIDIEADWYATSAAPKVVTVTGGTGAFGDGPFGEGPFGGGGPIVVTTSEPASMRPTTSTTTRITGYTVTVPDDGSTESVAFEFGSLLRAS